MSPHLGIHRDLSGQANKNTIQKSQLYGVTRHRKVAGQ